MENILTLETSWETTFQEKVVDSVTLRYLKKIEEQLVLDDKDRFVELDEFVTADKTCLLKKCVDTEYCEMDFIINSKFELHSLSLVSDCSKIEIFNGSVKEFYHTFYGNIIDDFEDTKSYRFDIVCKKLSDKFTLKFITNNDIIWIFGIQLQLQESTGNKPKNMFDLKAVRDMLENSKLDRSGNSEKCKILFDSFLTSSGKKPQLCDKTSTEIEEFKKHIDTKLIELENNVNERLNKIESDITEKLNKILFLIETNKNE